MVSIEQVILFRSLFHGRQDVYARYWEKGDKHGYYQSTILIGFNLGQDLSFHLTGYTCHTAPPH